MTITTLECPPFQPFSRLINTNDGYTYEFPLFNGIRL